MTKRRGLLVRATAVTAAVTGLAFGSGAFTQTTADRQLSLVVSNDDAAQLAIEPSGVNSNVIDTVEGDNNVRFNVDGEGASPSAVLSVGELSALDFNDPSDLSIETEAFTITNNADHAVDVSVDLETDGDVDIKLLLAEEIGSVDAVASVDSEGEIPDVGASDELVGALLFETSGAAAGETANSVISVSAIESELTD